jgi:hypothetical protein
LDFLYKDGRDWRWSRAHRLAFNNCEPDSHYDCELVRRTAEFIRSKQAGDLASLHADFPDIVGAEELTKAPLLTRLSIQARLLALEPVEQISTRTSIDVATIAAYEGLFYDFRWAYSATDYVLFRVACVDRLRDGTTTLRSTVLTLAYFGGPLVTEAMLDTLSRASLPLDMAKLVAGEGEYTKSDWMVLKALTVDCVPLNQDSIVSALKEFFRLRPVARVDPQPCEVAQGWTEADYAELLQPCLEAELTKLTAAAA